MKRFATVAIVALLLAAAVQSPPVPVADASPIIVGSPPGELAALQAQVESLTAANTKLMADLEAMRVAHLPPAPPGGDFRPATPVVKPTLTTDAPAAACASGSCWPASSGVRYTTTTRRGLFGRRR